MDITLELCDDLYAHNKVKIQHYSYFEKIDVCSKYLTHFVMDIIVEVTISHGGVVCYLYAVTHTYTHTHTHTHTVSTDPVGPSPEACPVISWNQSQVRRAGAQLHRVWAEAEGGEDHHWPPSHQPTHHRLSKERCESFFNTYSILL